MSEKDIINGLKKLESSAKAQEAQARETREIATALLRKLEGVSTPSSARKGRGLSAADKEKLRQTLYKNRIKS